MPVPNLEAHVALRSLLSYSSLWSKGRELSTFDCTLLYFVNNSHTNSCNTLVFNRILFIRPRQNHNGVKEKIENSSTSVVRWCLLLSNVDSCLLTLHLHSAISLTDGRIDGNTGKDVCDCEERVDGCVMNIKRAESSSCRR